MAIKFSATTVSLHMFDLEETAQLLSKLGFDGAEWRVRRIPDGKRSDDASGWSSCLLHLGSRSDTNSGYGIGHEPWQVAMLPVPPDRLRRRLVKWAKRVAKFCDRLA